MNPGGSTFDPGNLSPQKSSLRQSFNVNNGVLIIRGSAFDDQIKIVETVNNFLRVTTNINGEITDEAFDRFGVNEIRVFGEEGNDVIENFSSVFSRMNGGGGDDRIFGGSAGDIINGDGGNDFISGREGDDILRGQDGDDKIHGNEGNDMLQGGNGFDDLRGGEGDDDLSGGADDDLIVGSDGNDILKGGSGDDRINAGSGDDVVDGGSGDDFARGEDGEDVMNGGEGDDVMRGGADMDTMFGDDGDDRLMGDEDNDMLFGGAGQDDLFGSTGDDQLLGGADGDVIRGGDGIDDIQGEAGDDVLIGDAGNDSLLGGDGEDLMQGGDGDDTLDGQADEDVLMGNQGDDVLFHDFLTDIVSGGGQPGDVIRTRFHVDTLDDVSDGDFTTTNLSVREALEESNDDDIILFESLTLGGPATINMGVGTELNISSNLTIQGTGDDLLSIDANGLSRIFSVDAGTDSTISGIRLTGGDASDGGAIFTDGSITFNDVTFDANNSTSDGGAVFVNTGGSATIWNSVFVDNTANTLGGALYVENDANAYLRSTTVINNIADIGGGIFNDGGTLVVRNSTLSGNQANVNGGGYYQQADTANATFINSTISGNSGMLIGGMRVFEGDILLTNTTVAYNTASDVNSSGTGIFVDGSAGDVTLNNTIVFGNIAGLQQSDIAGTVSVATSFNNLIGTTLRSGGLMDGVNGNIVGVADAMIDPTLNFNGGQTQTHQVLAGSNAVDAGLNLVAVDENGFTLEFDQNDDFRIQNAVVDIGATELPI